MLGIPGKANSRVFFAASGFLLLLTLLALVAPRAAFAQATIATGSIQGTILDSSSAVVPGAKITITNKDTGQSFSVTTTSAGAYTSGSLVPGNYIIRVEAKGFSTVEQAVSVQVGTTSAGNITLAIGTATTVVEVAGETVAVNTEQPSVQGVLTKQQIENLPINGRNFLDLAQLEPGVQIQDGADFDPTKVGFSSISFGGRFGRTARIEVDGVDTSDETVGTTTENLPSSAIQEFQLAQSTLDLSNELTSSGAVNVVTRSGTNTYHGEAFGLFRDSVFSAGLPSAPGTSSPYQRSQMGANAGGPILKDKLFFFVDAEHTKQLLAAPVVVTFPFNAFSGNTGAPFRELDLLGKLDWDIRRGAHMFYRWGYFSNEAVSAGGGVGFEPYLDRNHTPSHVVGLDFNTGGFTHSIRFEYLKFTNNLSDAVLGTNLPFANFPVSMIFGGQSFFTGPNSLAPQATLQSNHQIKYDGSKTWGSHIIRYGVAFNHLEGGGFAAFNAITPDVEPIFNAAEQAAAATGPFNGTNGCPPGISGVSCPLNYPSDTIFLGNGLGFSSEFPAFGFPAGREGPDNRLGLYVGDSWKIKPNLTMTFGVRYVRDTGRTDSDLPALTALNNLLPGLGNPVRQPNGNLGPQVGLAWDPWKDGKTVIRAGIGEFFENAIWNNSEFDRPERLATGAFFAGPLLCSGGTPQAVPFPNGTTQTPPASICNDFIGNQAANIAAFQKMYQAASLAAGNNTSNPSYIPNLISSAAPILLGALAPDYKTPRAIQMNVGVQRELRPGMVLSVDYLRNVGLHYLLGIDANHSGDAAYFDKNAALQAIGATDGFFGCPGTNALAIQCAISSGTTSAVTGNPGASMADYAAFGLSSAADLGVGNCSQNVLLGYSNTDGSMGHPCAFPGLNPALGEAVFLYPIGRSVYNGMDVKLVENVKDPVRGVKYLNFQFAYSLSRFVNSGGSLNTAVGTAPAAHDQDFILQAVDNRNPLAFTGPAALDRTHQFSFGGYADLPAHFRLGTIFHFDSPLPSALGVPTSGEPGEIFRTDFTGDGTVGDPLPGTKIGSFMRGISVNGLTSVINNYNTNVANQATPAGQVLINNNLFTLAQLQTLGGVAPSVSTPPPGEVGISWLRTVDVSMTWVGTFHEHLTVEPSVSFYNTFNFANHDLPGNVLSGILTGSAGSVDGTPHGSAYDAQRVGVGTGVFALGAPRTIEFGLKLSF
jgi:Carboxypeptidase regulatory-like domain